MTTSTEFIPGRINLLILRDGKKATGYQVYERHVQKNYDAGRGFTLIKYFGGTDREATGYDVFITTDPKRVRDDCTCKGFLRYGKCKHHDALAECISCGLIGSDRRQRGGPDDRHESRVHSTAGEDRQSEGIQDRRADAAVSS